MVMGGLSAALAALTMPTAPPMVVLATMALVGMVAGGIWLAIGGALRHYRAVNETISSLLLNYIAIAVLNHLVTSTFRDPDSLNHPSTHHIGEANMIGFIPGTQPPLGLGVRRRGLCPGMVSHASHRLRLCVPNRRRQCSCGSDCRIAGRPVDSHRVSRGGSSRWIGRHGGSGGYPWQGQ